MPIKDRLWNVGWFIETKVRTKRLRVFHICLFLGLVLAFSWPLAKGAKMAEGDKHTLAVAHLYLTVKNPMQTEVAAISACLSSQCLL